VEGVRGADSHAQGRRSSASAPARTRRGGYRTRWSGEAAARRSGDARRGGLRGGGQRRGRGSCRRRRSGKAAATCRGGRAATTAAVPKSPACSGGHVEGVLAASHNGSTAAAATLGISPRRTLKSNGDEEEIAARGWGPPGINWFLRNHRDTRRSYKPEATMRAIPRGYCIIFHAMSSPT
jgi:hypothetical protein